MTILVFILVIVALILVHEFGHFVAAKATGMRVDEFGLGYPPRIAGIRYGETLYSINALPFGGFVRIYGEDGLTLPAPRSFISKSRLAQAVVLVAGVTMNVVFAWVLLSGALALGTPRALSPEELATARDAQLAVADVVAGSPAARAGLMPGDVIIEATVDGATWSGALPQTFTDFVASQGASPVTLEVMRGQEDVTLTATPATGVVASDPSRYALGVAVASIGVAPLPIGTAIVEGAQLTWTLTKETAVALAHFFASIFTLTANLAQVTGPVGIAGAVGSAAHQGFGDLLSLMALISINLAIINLIPIPALDGGRLLFVFVEAVIRRPIAPRFASAVNATGFALLILLMVVVTAHDVFKLVG